MINCLYDILQKLVIHLRRIRILFIQIQLAYIDPVHSNAILEIFLQRDDFILGPCDLGGIIVIYKFLHDHTVVS